MVPPAAIGAMGIPSGLLQDQDSSSSRKNIARWCHRCWLCLGEATTCAAEHIEDTIRPSTPWEKNACIFLVSLNGTGSLNSITPFASYAGWKSVWNIFPVFFANKILLGDLPPIRSIKDMKLDRANWMANCFLKAHVWLPLGRVLYMYCEKMLSLTRFFVISL